MHYGLRHIRRLTGHPCWSDDFERDLTEAARAIVEHGHSDLPSTYYAMLWLDIYEKAPLGSLTHRESANG